MVSSGVGQNSQKFFFSLSLSLSLSLYLSLSLRPSKSNTPQTMLMSSRTMNSNLKWEERLFPVLKNVCAAEDYIGSGKNYINGIQLKEAIPKLQVCRL
jgi:hypothetical protein